MSERRGLPALVGGPESVRGMMVGANWVDVGAGGGPALPAVGGGMRHSPPAGIDRTAAPDPTVTSRSPPRAGRPAPGVAARASSPPAPATSPRAPSARR